MLRLKEVSSNWGVAEGGHGPFRGLDAPFALAIRYARGWNEVNGKGDCCWVIACMNLVAFAFWSALVRARCLERIATPSI